MPDFRRVSNPDPDAATVEIFRKGKATLARIKWPPLGRPSGVVGPTVGRTLLVRDALDAAASAYERGTVPDVVVMIKDEAFWDKAWGRLI